MVKNVAALVELMKLAAAKYESQDALARAMGIDPTRFSRVKKGNAGAFNVLNCLKLAKILGRHPGEILRVAGKDEIADRLDELYGPDAHAALRVDSPELAARWRAMDTDARTDFMKLAKRFGRLPEDWEDRQAPTALPPQAATAASPASAAPTKSKGHGRPHSGRKTNAG